MRNGELYQLEVRFESKRRMGVSWFIKATPIPGSLSSLGQSLRPELGSKGEVDHTSVVLDNLASRKRELVEYMKPDIYLLGGIMLQAQNIYWSLYELDITTKITLSSLALTIFRKDYYNEMSTPIAIPHRTAEEFIRRGYYGGHADVYMPRGDNLFCYIITFTLCIRF